MVTNEDIICLKYEELVHLSELVQFSLPKLIISYKPVWIYISTSIPIKCCINPTNWTSLLSSVSEYILAGFSLHVLVPLPKVKKHSDPGSSLLSICDHLDTYWNAMDSRDSFPAPSGTMRKNLKINHLIKLLKKSLDGRFPGEEYQYHIVCIFNFAFFWNKIAQFCWAS